MTLAEIKLRALSRLDETATVSQRYPDANLEEYILDGARFYVARTGCKYADVTITSVAETMFYDLPCDCIQVTRVLWDSNGSYIPLEPQTARDLDEMMVLWQRQRGDQARYYFLLGLDKISFWPMTATGGQNYIVHYKQDPTPAVTNVPVEDHECLVDYAVARCLLIDGKAKEATEEYVKYEATVKAAQRRMANADRVWRRNMI